MSSLLRKMPLLLMELQQQAAAKRTYVLRFVYAATLFGVACFLFYSANNAEDTSVLGRGEKLFEQLFRLQYWGLGIVVPALTCGVITEEKGRNTLGILLMSPLGGIRITTQKLIGRLVPMFSFVLLSLPLLSVAYSYGGITEGGLLIGVVQLLLTCLQVGALGLLMSVLSRTTLAALVVTYGVFLLTNFLCVPLWPAVTVSQSSAGYVGFSMLLSAIVSIICLMVATFLLTSRAFQNSHNYLLQMQGQIDRFVVDVNRLFGNITVTKPERDRPAAKPIAWRETDRKSLGRLRYLIRILIVVELPLIALAATVNQNVGLFHTLLRAGLWIGGLALLGTHSSGLVAGERSRGTMEVLLTTPITGRSILQQKVSGLWRLIIVLGIPLLTLFLIETIHAVSGGMSGQRGVANLIWSALCVAVWLPTLAWFGVFVSTRIRTQARAALLVLSTVAGLLVVPTVAASILQVGGVSPNIVRVFALISPTQIQAAHSPWAHVSFSVPNIPLWVMLTHLMIVAGTGFACRHLALRDIDVVLGRIPEDFEINQSLVPEEALVDL